MAVDDLLNHLRELEVALHHPSVRSDMNRLDELLHPSFVEFGWSGRAYNKADIMKALSEEQPPPVVWSQDFSLAEIADGVALLTYKSARVENGEKCRHALRASLWQRTERGWQVRFHQATPTEAFSRPK